MQSHEVDHRYINFEGFVVRLVLQPCVATVVFTIRWISSEWNPADNPSRGVWKPSIPKQFFGDGDISQSDDVRAHSLEQSETPVEAEGGVRNDTTTKRIEASISTQGGSNKFGGRRVADRNPFKEEEQDSKTDSQGTNQRHSPEQDSFGRSFSFKGLPQQIFVPLVDSKGALKSVKQVDRQLASFLEKKFLEGDDISTAQYIVASVVYFNPSLKAPNMQLLPRVKSCLKGWRKLAPGRSRLPVPWEVVCLLVDFAMKENKAHFAIHMLMMFTMYMRPTEALRVRCIDVVKPTGRRGQPYRNWTFVMHPFEVGVPSKTLEFDESLELDLDYHRGVGELIHRYINHHHIAQKSTVLGHANKDLTSFMEEASNHLNLQVLGKIDPYRFRHGGASHDAVNRLRDLNAIQMRGRWKSAASVRRYQKGARLNQIFGSLPAAVQRSCHAAAGRMADTLQLPL